MVAVYFGWVLLILSSNIARNVFAEPSPGCQSVAIAVLKNSSWSFNRDQKALQWLRPSSKPGKVPQCSVSKCTQFSIAIIIIWPQPPKFFSINWSSELHCHECSLEWLMRLLKFSWTYSASVVLKFTISQAWNENLPLRAPFRFDLHPNQFRPKWHCYAIDRCFNNVNWSNVADFFKAQCK